MISSFIYICAICAILQKLSTNLFHVMNAIGQSLISDWKCKTTLL